VSAQTYQTYQLGDERLSAFPAFLLFLVLVLSALGVIAHASFV
jgi:hypothetical protein